MGGVNMVSRGIAVGGFKTGGIFVSLKQLLVGEDN